MPIVALVLAVGFGFALLLLLRAHSADRAAARARAMLQEARDRSDERAAQLLAQCCAECEKILASHPRHLLAWHVWGAALWCLGRWSPADKADALFAEAEEKFSRALEIKPDETKLAIDLCWVLWERAGLHSGVMGLEYLERICEESDRLLVRKPGEARLLNFWASALCCMGTRMSGPDADSMLAAAEAKFKEVLAVTPNDQNVMSSLGNVLWRRSRLRHGDEAREFLIRAWEWLEKALEVKPGDPRALSTGAWVLYARTRLMPGEETNRMLADAAARFAVAESGGADVLLQGQGVLLWAQSRCVGADQAAELLQQAKTRLAEAESHDPESAAYNLACVCAQLGETDECRHWLEKSREPGILVSREQMASEEELANVREYAWFRQLLGY